MCTRSGTNITTDHLANSMSTKVAEPSSIDNTFGKASLDDNNTIDQAWNQRRRRVRFDTEHHLIEPSSGSILPASKMSDTEKAQLFWHDGDFQGFKSNARDIATMVRRSDDSNQSASYCSVLLRTHNSCTEGSKPSLGDTALLSHWIRVGTSRRGLEHWCSKTIGSSIRNRKNRVIDGVLGAQRAATVAKLNVAQKEDYIRETYQGLSLSAKIFAETMGKADEEAAREHASSTRKVNNTSGFHHRSSLCPDLLIDSPAISLKDQYLNLKIERPRSVSLPDSSRPQDSNPLKSQSVSTTNDELPGKSAEFQWQQQLRTTGL
mmetsp:Transcript_17129/g.26525  ORF Transcript_17129/g.26525 Transcript_17129/m.26525 type:complete len:320 (+) Transcript_17129:192-1151(+)|eukprot:CAMPEP_0195295072 /NCGR_PEP_ID=MMETSP0707-20130614/16552_1 /TAXON_ID=33640 /ORGANISM="Asterionellopsis glacialis, Strain CCMP134" /LENGTH=319 /DNA_ID=CAMNT_0040356211 /DNA_START=186 /DNA_END=1145 /DNA_ORIENTATION=+